MDIKEIKQQIDNTVKSLQEKNLPAADIEEAVSNLRSMYEKAYSDEEKRLDSDMDTKFAEIEANLTKKADEKIAAMKEELTKKADPKLKAVYGFKSNKTLAELKDSDKKADKVEKQAIWLSSIIKLAGNRDDEDARMVVKALSEGTDAEGGHLVPEEFKMDLITDLRDAVNFRQISTIFPMATKTLELPKLTARPSSYWTGENITSTTTSAEFGNLVLTARKLISRIYTSSELAEDSSPAVVDLLRGLFVQSMKEAEEEAFSTGNGTTRPKGISQETLGTVAAGGAMTGDHLIDLLYSLGQGYRSNASWMMNSRTWRAVMKLKDSNGAYLVDREILKNNTTPVLLGRPVYENDNLASSEVYVGDFRFYYIGDRGQISVVTTTEADNTFARDQVQIKSRERVDGKMALTNAFRKITSSGVS